jgi:hypothetical protein
MRDKRVLLHLLNTVGHKRIHTRHMLASYLLKVGCSKFVVEMWMANLRGRVKLFQAGN